MALGLKFVAPVLLTVMLPATFGSCVTVLLNVMSWLPQTVRPAAALIWMGLLSVMGPKSDRSQPPPATIGPVPSSLPLVISRMPAVSVVTPL